MSGWRPALNYVQYSGICAKIVRQVLKGDAKVDAAKRGESLIRVTPWKDGKPLTTKS